MVVVIKCLYDAGVCHPPKFLPSNTHYEVMMGSVAYGVSSDTSDIDIYGWCIPKKEDVFPHLKGSIPGFGRQIKLFEQYQEHHIKYKEKNYDIQIFGIVKYFQLAMDNNPNMIDSLFVPQNCILNITRVGQIVRENRRVFLHKGVFHKMKGYAYSQLHKAKIKNPIGKRKELVDKYGYDTKFMYHVVRLMSQAEQILTEGDLDLQEKSRRDHMKAVRRGDLSIKDITDWFQAKEIQLLDIYNKSTLRDRPDEESIKSLLINCLEEHYGSLSECINIESKNINALKRIGLILEEIGIK